MDTEGTHDAQHTAPQRPDGAHRPEPAVPRPAAPPTRRPPRRAPRHRPPPRRRAGHARRPAGHRAPRLRGPEPALLSWLRTRARAPRPASGPTVTGPAPRRSPTGSPDGS
ncbi:hypothetical protein O1L68_11170 [Streptomyces lydicus]|nr:hypothetical protein [Streptomyces lydicus]